jgi:hypothetical protein
LRDLRIALRKENLSILGIIEALPLEGDATSPAAMEIEGQVTKAWSPESGGTPEPRSSILKKCYWDGVLAIV